ncbi:MAG: hypothetical protein ACR2G5_03290 [Pyrinomonadaceae bacterium]
MSIDRIVASSELTSDLELGEGPELNWALDWPVDSPATRLAIRSAIKRACSALI